MKINNKILAIATAVCLPVAFLTAACCTNNGFQFATSPGYANPSGECDETCVSDTPAIDGACGAPAGPGVSGHECTLDPVGYLYSEYEPRMHWDPIEEELYCTCDLVYWEIAVYWVPHNGFLCRGKPVPADPPTGGS